MARVGRKGKRRQSKEIFIGVFLLVFAISIVAGAGLYMNSRPQPLNRDTLCPAVGPAGHYVLLVDKTDPLNFTQKQAFSVMLRDLVEKRVPEGFLLSVFVLGEDFKQSASPLAELCNPGTGADKSELTANLKKRQAHYQEKFVVPLMNQSEGLVGLQSAKSSPIFEMLQLVGVNAFRKHAIKGQKRLIIMSDMLHNTPQFSMYGVPVDYQTFASSDYGRKMQLEMNKVDVELHYLMNSPKLQTKRNLKFWEDYFAKAGARIVAVQPIEG